MSAAYTDDDVQVASRAITRQNMPNASDKLVDLLVEQGEWADAARWVLDAVAPAIAARVLRDEADFVSKLRRSTSQQIAEYLRTRADEIERTH